MDFKQFKIKYRKLPEYQKNVFLQCLELSELHTTIWRIEPNLPRHHLREQEFNKYPI